jgi:hypothetical protein
MDNKLLELLQAAKAKTESGRLKWQAFDGESFRAAIGSGYLHIHRLLARIENDDGNSHPAATFSAQVSDEQGRIVADADATQGFSDGGEYRVLAELFDTARKSALTTKRCLRVCSTSYVQVDDWCVRRCLVVDLILGIS